MTKLSARTRFALELISAKPEAMAWPGNFADAFWPRDFRGPSGAHLHEQRNKQNAPMASWWAAGYLGRLRKRGLIGGGLWGHGQRDPLYLTELARELLKNA